MELFPTIARNVRRIGPWATVVIAARVCWYWPRWGWRRLVGRRSPRVVERRPW